MRVNLRRLHTLMTQQFLHGADVIMLLQHLRCETVTQHMWRHPLVELRLGRRRFDGNLETAIQLNHTGA